MKFYNTLSRELELFKPQDDAQVSVYTCGPTVYDSPHIGNWFAFIRWDILTRILRGAGFKTKWVMNITDVGHLVSDADEGEDKLEVGAKREGKTAWDIAKNYENEFLEGMEHLNFAKPDVLPKATQHIQEQIDLIKILESKGYTYQISDGVYFDTSKFKDYGELAQLDIEHLKAGARVDINPEKKNATDFALWKLSPEQGTRDMEWDSPWGKGFPGWHIECSAMSMKYLGETIDIHGGGIDHIPIHHTNEIAQSEAATGKHFVNYWLHSNFILVDSKKMSKSLGNYFTLQDIAKHGFDPLAFRLLVLQSHYRTEAHFSWENMQASANRLNGYRAMADLRYQAATGNGDSQVKLFEDFEHSFQQALEHDLDTPQALEQLSVLATTLSETLIADSAIEAYAHLLKFVDDRLGLNLLSSEDIDEEAKRLLAKRAESRKAKQWEESDILRSELENTGLGVRDTTQGQIWYRI